MVLIFTGSALLVLWFFLPYTRQDVQDRVCLRRGTHTRDRIVGMLAAAPLAVALQTLEPWQTHGIPMFGIAAACYAALCWYLLPMGITLARVVLAAFGGILVFVSGSVLREVVGGAL
jgi:hypothetical protein